MKPDDALSGELPGGPWPPTRRLIEELLAAAVAAPSMHNTQPWHFEIHTADDVIDLSLDPARLLSVADPHNRAAHIACGAALFNLRLAAAVAGVRLTVRPVPDPSHDLLLARIRLSGPHEATPWERELRAAIPLRHSNREPFSNRVVPPGIRAELAEAVAAEGAVLQFADHEEAMRLRRLAADAERDLLADPAYRAEIARWVGGERDEEGIPAAALGPRSPEGREPVRDFSRDRRATARYAWFEERPQLVVLSVQFSGPVDWLKAGQALERVWLTATARGISACPLTQALETQAAWQVRDPRSEGSEKPQMILRIGYGLPIPARVPRRKVADVTDWP
jgi:nitroreductase